MEFAPEGNLVNSWGDMKVLGNYLHDCQVDNDGNLWIAAARSGFVQKYSRDGKLLLQIGKSGVFDSSDGTAKGKPLNSNTAQFFGPSAVDVDPANGDVYVGGGQCGGNFRIAVLDKNGTFLRQFRLHHTEAEKTIAELPHCMRLSNDGLVYVCDRLANRLQAFDKMGNFIRNIDIPWKNYTAENEDLRKYCHMLWRTFPPCSLLQKIGRGTSAVSVEFSRDQNQRFIYVVNQNQREVDILDHVSGQVVSTIGGGTGLFFPGQLFDAIRAAVDSKGNVYVAEDEGRRLQRFKILAPSRPAFFRRLRVGSVPLVARREPRILSGGAAPLVEKWRRKAPHDMPPSRWRRHILPAIAPQDRPRQCTTTATVDDNGGSLA